MKGVRRDQQQSAVYEVLLSAMNDMSRTRVDHLVEGCGSIENMTTVRRESIAGSGMYPRTLSHMRAIITFFFWLTSH